MDCGAPGEELRLGVMMTGDGATAIKALLEPGRPIRVIGRLRAVRAGLAAGAGGERLEVVAESIEPADS